MFCFMIFSSIEKGNMFSLRADGMEIGEIRER